MLSTTWCANTLRLTSSHRRRRYAGESLASATPVSFKGSHRSEASFTFRSVRARQVFGRGCAFAQARTEFRQARTELAPVQVIPPHSILCRPSQLRGCPNAVADGGCGPPDCSLAFGFLAELNLPRASQSFQICEFGPGTLESMGNASVPVEPFAMKWGRVRLALAIVLIVTVLAISTRAAVGGADFVCKNMQAPSPVCHAGYSTPPLAR